MSSLSDIRSGIATRLATITGLRNAATIPDQPNPPVAIVIPQRLSYDTAFADGVHTYTFTVQVIVGRVAERISQNLLDGYVSPTGNASIKTAIEGDKTLGGKALDVRVTEMTAYQSLVVGEITYMGAEFEVSVLAQ